MREALLYREYSPSPTWARVLLWLAVAGGAVAVLREPDMAGFAGGALVAGLMLFGIVLERFLFGLTVTVHRDRVRFGLGRGGPIAGEVRYERVARLESVEYRPLRDFGGWGVRGSTNRRAWTASGHQAVVLHLHDGRQIYLGSANPRRLEERIRAAMAVASS